MLKNVIAPLQGWLLSQGRCVGCSMPLSQGVKSKKGTLSVVTCKCKRVYVSEPTTKTYRRALMTEV